MKKMRATSNPLAIPKLKTSIEAFLKEEVIHSRYSGQTDEKEVEEEAVVEMIILGNAHHQSMPF